uniref:GLOBIN domain-containing protein n=1 Tax=Heligmosomoides polygyrus TaxID=6339 RepID=A0A8L8L0W1_HELPZ
LGRRMFECIFTENPHYLAYLNLKGEPNWSNHISFKIHVQRFVTALSEAMRRLRDPSTSYDVLRDFGASYAVYPKRVSAVYFERLANALNQTATQLQEGDHQGLEFVAKSKTKMFQMAANPDENLISNERKKSCKSLMDGEKVAEEEQMPGSASFSSFSTSRNGLSSRSSPSQVNSTRHSHTDYHGPHDICPITVEAWTVLSAFLANQIKYGYEMERVIRTELSKLGLDGSGGMKRGHFSLQRPTQFA